MTRPPNLSISPEKVFFIVAKARRSEINSTGTASALELSDSDDDGYGLSNHGPDTDRSELTGFIRELNVDEQIDLVGLMWLGRGDAELGSWRDLRGEAERAHNNRTASYLIGTPLLADYLEEAMSQFGQSFEDYEDHL